MIRRRSGKDGPGKNRGEKWNRNPVECGSQHRGWLAGPPFGAWIHYFRSGSKPCLTEMTDHAIACPHCQLGLVPDWRGYTPYYDEQYTPRFVMITFEFEECVSEIEHLAQVIIRRGKNKTDPIIVENKPWRTTPIPYSPKRERPVDLARFLVFTLWQDPTLIDWCKKPHYSAPEQNTPKQDDSFSNDPGLQRMKKLLERENTAKQESATVEEAMVKVINQATTPKPNGSPFKKPR